MLIQHHFNNFNIRNIIMNNNMNGEGERDLY